MRHHRDAARGSFDRRVIDGKKLADRRRKAGYSIERIAQVVGVRPDKIEQWETGDSVPDANQLFALLAWLKIDPARAAEFTRKA